MTVRVIDAEGEPQIFEDAEAVREMPNGSLLVIADLQDDPTVGRVLSGYPPRGWRRFILEGDASTVLLPDALIGDGDAEEPLNPQQSPGAGRSPFDSITLTYAELRQLIALHLHQAQLTMGRLAPWLDVEHQARAMADGETPLRISEVLGLPHPVEEPTQQTEDPTQQTEPRPAAVEPLVLFDRDPEDLSAAVQQAGGAFSVCWESMSGTGVFRDDRARAVADQLIAWIEERYQPRPLFGLRLGTAGGDGEPLDAQVARLAGWIAANVPGEPSRSEGAIDCALRLLRTLVPSLPPTLHDGDEVAVEDADGKGITGRVAAWTAAPGGHPFVILCEPIR